MYELYPAMAPVANSSELLDINRNFTVAPGLGRSAKLQAGYQMIALGMTLGVALIGGAITGGWCYQCDVSAAVDFIYKCAVNVTVD